MCHEAAADPSLGSRQLSVDYAHRACRCAPFGTAAQQAPYQPTSCPTHPYPALQNPDAPPQEELQRRAAGIAETLIDAGFKPCPLDPPGTVLTEEDWDRPLSNLPADRWGKAGGQLRAIQTQLAPIAGS